MAKSQEYVQYINSILRPMRNGSIVTLDLFAGAGGLALGFEAQGFKTIGFEKDADCCATYRNNLGSPCYQFAFSPDYEFPDATVIIGGPPCQPFSVGGKQEGLTDSRYGFPTFICLSLCGKRQGLSVLIGFDCFAPTLRSGFTGPRKSTSILNSRASQKVWEQLQIWPNGVQKSREEAIMFPPENGHFRLSVRDCALLQGFPDDWIFQGAACQVLGQIGNSVCPPVGYAIAKSVSYALGVYPN